MPTEKLRPHLPAFLVQVLATTVGLLLALGLDQWRDRRRQEALASQHLRSIQSELLGNDQEIAQELKSFAATEALLAEALMCLEQGRRPDPDRRLSLSLATLRQSSWDMAVAGQTPLRSDLGRMARLATAYEGLRTLRSVQDQVLAEMEILEALGGLLEHGRLPGHLPRTEAMTRLRALRSKLVLIGNLAPSVRSDLAKALQP